MQVNHSNIISALIVFCILLGVSYLHTEYNLPLTKPVIGIIGLILVKLWLRTVNTTTYILVHICFFLGLVLAFQHYADKMKSMSTFETFKQIEATIQTVKGE